MRSENGCASRANRKPQRFSMKSMTNATGINAAAGRIGQMLSSWRGRVSRILSDESGQALVLTAVSMTALMGAMALGVDVGFIHYKQSQLQTAADSAAIAAGLEMGNCSNTVCANMKTAAAQALVEDGITTSTITPTSSCTISHTSSLAMIINVAPCVLGTSDPNNGNTHMAEVVLTAPQSMFFGALIGFPKMNLVARAEAGDSLINTASSGGNCVWAGSVAFNSSDGGFNLTNCGMYINGNLQTDSGDSVTATDFLYYGTWSPNNCNNSCTWTLGDSETQPTHTTTQQNDPLAGLTAPSQPATQDSGNCSISNQDCWGHNVTAGTAVSVPPGYYGGGININSNVIVNLSPGLYYFNGSLNVDSGATLECTTCTEGGAGVTLYFTSGSFQPNSSSTVTLNAPATGYTSNSDVANMLVWQSSTNSTGMDLDASTSVTLNGIIYLPDATLTLNSGSGTTINAGATATAVDVQSMIVDSGITFDVNGSQSLLGGTGSGKTLGSFALAE
jgi:Flp pilus assembly protein TadG